MTARALPALAACLALASSGGAAAHAGLVLPPLTSLPSVRGVPGLWFDGAHPEEVAALRARAEHPRTAAHLEAIEDFVDAHLDTLAGADDETRAELALGAALLTVLDRVPPAGTGFASYRDASVAALRGIGNRQAVDDVVEVFWRPADAIDLVRDTSLLSSMAQAYDLLAGSDVGAQDDAALRALLARWANALRDDWNLRGGPGVTARRDTWGIKAGASLLSAALALPDHPDAESWRAAAMTYLQGSLALVAGATGWYTEGAWYLGHALATLVPCAWHVRHATGVDWFGALRPLVTTAFALRQPDGRAPPLASASTRRTRSTSPGAGAARAARARAPRACSASVGPGPGTQGRASTSTWCRPTRSRAKDRRACTRTAGTGRRRSTPCASGPSRGRRRSSR